jgi:hypothetical protein
MSPLIAPKSAPRVLPPEGTHIARCVGLIHIGTIETPFGMSNKIRLTWELPEELHEFKQGDGEKPFTISAKYTLSLAEKSNLLPIVEGMMGFIPEDVRESFNMEDLVGIASLLSVKYEKTKKGTEYASIASTAQLMKNQKAPEQFNSSKILTYEKWNQEYFDTLPDFIKLEMESSKEFQEMKGIKEDDNGENVPF